MSKPHHTSKRKIGLPTYGLKTFFAKMIDSGVGHLQSFIMNTHTASLSYNIPHPTV